MSVNTFGIEQNVVSDVQISAVVLESNCGSCVGEMSEEWLKKQVYRMGASELLVNGREGQFVVYWQSREQWEFGEFLFSHYGLGELLSMPVSEFAAIEKVFSSASAVGVQHFYVLNSGGEVFCIDAAIVVFQFLENARTAAASIGVG